jgi:hypothetical protein
MSKRSVNVLTGIIIIALVVAIISYFLSPNFQGWVQVWLGRPDGLAASATTLAALATLFAVIVGLRGIHIGRELARDAFQQSEEAREESRRQFLEAQYDDHRPLLAPVPGGPAVDPGGPAEEQPIVFDWNGDYMFVTIQNVGTGIATNVWLALLPPAPLPESSNQYASRLGSPVLPGAEPLKVYVLPDTTLFDANDSINGHHLCVPLDRATAATERADSFIARLTITCQDIFGRKHASIFDISNRGLWVNVAFLSSIERDLGEIDVAKTGKRATAKIEA